MFSQDSIILKQTPTLFSIRALTNAIICYLPIEECRGLLNGASFGVTCAAIKRSPPST